MTAQVSGDNLIGLDHSSHNPSTFKSFDPREGKPDGFEFHEADAFEIEQALNLAEQAAHDLRGRTTEQICGLLSAIREEISNLGDTLVEMADRESALGLDRLRGERDRTTNQIRLFTDLIQEGSWVDAVIDTALPERKPLPRPDIRRMLMPLGPVAVFGASNFPLAFSVAGGDTVSALAARNPVVIKAHPAHPATSELVGEAIVKAVRMLNFHPGTFALLHGLRPEPSIALAEHPKTKAVAFTGSQRAGRALFDAAARRPSPIPVFSEMGSVNPVFVLDETLAKNADAIAEGLFRSVMLGVGQFCTCPGLVFAIESEALARFTGKLTELFADAGPGVMLNGTVAKGYAQAVGRASGIGGVSIQRSWRPADPAKTEGQPSLLLTSAENWLEHHELHEEIFGPATVVVRCDGSSQMLECAQALDGTLTATIHGTPNELATHSKLLRILSDKAGRIIFNAYPTGVEVGYAMHHGGPYPSTTDPRFTSVGARAILRFVRPVCFQGFPDAQLPPELQNANPRGIWRTVNGKLTREAL